MNVTPSLQPDLSIIIVSYKNDPEVLRACFMSLAASRDVTFETFVIENAGDARVAQIAFEALPDTYVRISTENLGFAKAVNDGMKKARGRYTLLLNPDTVVPPDALRKMVDHLDQDINVGIASSVIRYEDGTLQESIRRFPTLIDQLLILFKVPHLLPNIGPVNRYMMRDMDPLVSRDVDSIMGAFMFIRPEVIQKIGFLDERFFIWFEEVDYCKMARDAGFTIRHYADVAITHHKGKSFGQVSTLQKQRWIRKSMRQYFRKHGQTFAANLLLLLSPVLMLLGRAANTVKPK